MIGGLLVPNRTLSSPVSLAVQLTQDYEDERGVTFGIERPHTGTSFTLGDLTYTARMLRETLTASLAYAEILGAPRQPRRDYVVEALRMESDLMLLLGLPAVFARPTYLKSMLGVIREAWNIRVAVRRDRAVLEKEIAEAEADKAYAELRAQEATAKALELSARLVPSPRDMNARPKSAEVVIQEFAEGPDPSEN